MNPWFRRIPAAVVVAAALSFSTGADAASRSVESVQNNVRKVTIVDDRGTRREIFERRDQFTCAWFEARLDSSTNDYVYTDAGERARRARVLEVENFQRNIDRVSYK